MQFVRQGPDLPERLLQAHEDGRVVFFCGAGVSYPAGLPGFSGLVKSVFAAVGASPSAVQQAAIDGGQYDTAIGLLESSIVGGREIVRRAISTVLTPTTIKKDATATHDALLTLAKTRDGRTRLITTNFDRLFETVIDSKSIALARYQAPLLPVPKNRWDGLVYLHGLLAAMPTASNLDHLVVSSGDFGLAYLTERWAARFVGELFRNYTVCFVGYSINDPVLRYMMDALAADRLLGESPPEMFAFGSFSKGKEENRANEWRAKNVTPLLYREHHRHYYLHRTLREWSATYRDGARGKERIVVDFAMARPMASTKQDDFVGRMLWALADLQGLPAKRFAEFNPVPSLEWLEPLCDERYGYGELSRFGVPPHRKPDADLTFSMTRRPAAYDKAPMMALVGASTRGSQWDEVMRQLARWLLRHLGDPALILWLAKRGGRLHDDFRWLVERRLEELGKFAAAGDEDALANIRSNATAAVPGRLMRTLWRLMLTRRVKDRQRDFELHSWMEQFQRDGLTPALRIELRELLTPCVSLREPFRWEPTESNQGDAQRYKDLVEWEVVLTSDHVHSTLESKIESPEWRQALPTLLSDFNTLLRDTLDLMSELDGADSKTDLSYLQQPSITAHPQNKGFRDWTVLVDLTRDAWRETMLLNPELARLTAEGWWHEGYPLFKRLAFFAATHERAVAPGIAVAWLLSDGRWWLWSIETQRETMRLLISLAPRLSVTQRQQLETAILAGPPREMFNSDIDQAQWDRLVARNVWLRLAKLKVGGGELTAAAALKLDEISIQNPLWELAEDERDEFPTWMETGWVGDRDPWLPFVSTPRSRSGLRDYLRQNPVLTESKQDDWSQRCRDSFQASAYALCDLAKNDVWPLARWRDALQGWSEERLLPLSWKWMGPVIAKSPDGVVESLLQGVSWWLQALAKTFTQHEDEFLTLCLRVLACDEEIRPETDDPVGQAINHPVGHTTEALLRWWYRRNPEDDQGLPSELRAAFTDLCDPNVRKFRHGRVLLAAHVIALYRVDTAWTTKHLLPLFDWQRSSVEASAAWEGFLWSPRLYRPLLAAIKQPFLDTASHYAQLGDHGKQYAGLLTFAALDPGETFTKGELANATGSLPSEGLAAVAQALVSALSASGDQRGSYWSNRVAPYLRSVWPKARDRLVMPISEQFSLLCVAAQEAFPEAFDLLRGWLQPLPFPEHVVRLLHESKIARVHPESVLAFLDKIVGESAQWPPTTLKACLDEISSAEPKLKSDQRFERLMSYLRVHGLAP